MDAEAEEASAAPTRSEGGLADLEREVEADPVVRAAYEDANRRTATLASMQRIRQAEGLSQHDVAAAMQTTQSAVSDIESGRVDPRFRTLQRYARAVNRRLDVAMVDRDLPAFGDGVANELWRLMEERALSPLLSGLSNPTPAEGKTLVSLAEDYARLPPAIVRSILASLQTRGWVVTSHDGDEELFRLQEDAGFVVGVSLHRDNAVGALLNLGGQVIQLQSVHLADTGVRSIIDAVVDIVARLRRPERTLGVGVVLAGVVRPDTGTVNFAPDLQTPEHPWHGVEFAADLEDAIHTRVDEHLLVVVENDANAVALREYLRCGEPYVVAVLLSESGAGIGMGSVVEGHVLYGMEGCAGEAGHFIVDQSSPVPCRSGADHYGCLESVASPRGILQRLGLPASNTGEVTEGLAAANDRVRRDDKEAAAAFYDAGNALGGFIAATMIGQDPTRVAIHGQRELVGENHPSALSFRTGMFDGLRGGVTKQGSFASRLAWYTLDDRIETEAAGAAAMQHFVYRPDHWQHHALVSRALPGRRRS